MHVCHSAAFGDFRRGDDSPTNVKTGQERTSEAYPKCSPEQLREEPCAL